MPKKTRPRKVNTYLVEFHRRGVKRAGGAVLLEATTGKFARNWVYRKWPGVVVDRTTLYKKGSMKGTERSDRRSSNVKR